MKLTVPNGYIEVQTDGVFYNPQTQEIVICGFPQEDDESHNCDEMGCSTLSHVLLRGYSKPEGKTISEWEEIFNVKIIDPDGFNRKDPMLRERKFTREQFEKGMMLSSIKAKFLALAKEQGVGE